MLTYIYGGILMDYKTLLKDYENYDTSLINIEKFYINGTELNLAKKKYNLLEIAGTGTEISQILNVLFWIHNKIKHVSNANLPLKEMNLDGILTSSKNVIGNCFTLSTALTESLISLGFKSRYIRCMPFDYMDGDCHVVVEVFSNDLKKWIMIDPTFQCYLSDENNVILSIKELRKKLIENEKIKFNKEFNYNNEAYDRDEYLIYMSKNTFHFEMQQINGYGAETIENNFKLELSPLFYDGKGNNLKFIECTEKYIKSENINDEIIIQFLKDRKDIILNRTIYTHNEEEFWK